jgi:hypothetical protein
MIRKFVPTGTGVLIALSLILASCTSGQPTLTVPTLDTNLVYTQAAQTVQAGIEMTAAARPPATQTLQPSNTPEGESQPTVTLQPADDQQPTVTLQSEPTTEQTPLVGAQQTATTAPDTGVAPPAQTSGDKCDWVDQSPKDGTLIKKDASWDNTILVKNSGTSTWDKSYALKFWGGDRLGSPADFYLQNDVKPGETYRFVFSMKAPSDLGKKQANWVIQNGSGGNFCPLFLQVEIVD